MRATWVFAVASLMTSCSQISGFDSPRASRSKTSRSRGVSSEKAAGSVGVGGGLLPRELLDHRACDGRGEE